MKKSLIISIATGLIGIWMNVQAGNTFLSSYETSEYASSLKGIENASAVFNTRTQAETVRYSMVRVNANSPSTRRNSHWLVNDEEEIAPFAPDELDVLPERPAHSRSIKQIRRIERRKDVEAKEIIAEKAWYDEVREDEYLEVFLSGGGFRGGVNPKIHDQIMISNSGFVQQYFESEVTGVTERKKIVDRDQVFALVRWIAESGFFELEREYSCARGDENCRQRMDVHPRPIPLRIVVAMGPYRNVVSVPIFSADKKNEYIDCPDTLKKIVKAIYDFASL
jgi:hypothetical protein